MKRTIALGLLLILGAACSDETKRAASPTAPAQPMGSPALTSASVPDGASSICRAAVAERDKLNADVSAPASQRYAKISSVTAVIDDACY